MYLSRLILNPSSRAVRNDLHDCQGLHRTLLKAFPVANGDQGARTAFGLLYRVDEDVEGRQLVLYAQSEVRPDWSLLPSGFALDVACKAVAEHFAKIEDGRTLRFRLRANPTRKVDTKSGPDGQKRNGRRVGLRGEVEQVEWLRRKGEAGGFRVLTLEVRPAGRDGMVEGKHRAGELRFKAVEFEGSLQVTAAGLFRQTLAQGLGSGKAYGFGLLSVSP